MNEYKEILDGVTASEQAKHTAALKLQEAYAEKKRGRRVGRYIKYACAAAASVCIIFIAVFSAIIFSPANAGDPENRVYYRIGETCTMNDSSITFKEIKLTEQTDGAHIIINGIFDFESFSVSDEGIRLYPSNRQNADKLNFNLDAQLTTKLSEANLNFNSSPAQSKGAVSLAFTIERGTAEFLKQCTETDGRLELMINVLYGDSQTPVFVFAFDEIKIN